MAPDEPIFVVGFPRSGTTLLQALLGSHSRIAAAPELHFVRRIWSLGHDWGDLHDDDVLRRVVTETVRPRLGFLDDAGFDPERVFERARSGPRTFAGVLDATLRDFADRQGKPRWSEKSPRQLPKEVWSLAPSAKVVHIVRDPRETVVSAAAKLGRYDTALDAAREWRTFTAAAVDAGNRKGPAQYLRIRYEDLAADPAAELRIVFAFLGEDWDPAVLTDLSRRGSAVAASSTAWMAEALSAVRPAEVGAWLRLTRLERARVLDVVGDLLLGLGYPPAPVRSATLGRVLNTLAEPAYRRRQRQRLQELRALTTPEQRFQYSLREQERIAETGLAKVRGRSAD